MAIHADDFEELPEHEPAWMALDRATACRKQLLAAGFLPLPCNGKIPPVAGWSDIEVTRKIIDKWATEYSEALNSGIICRTTPAIDLDILHVEAADALEQLAREHFEERGNILVRFGQAPKRLIVLRTDEPFNKIKRLFVPPNGKAPGEKDPGIEILCHGQQFVAFGTHPDTHRPYSWHGGEPGQIKRDDLPYVREADMRAFIEDATKLLVEDFGFKIKTDDASKHKANGSEQPRYDGTAGIRERAWARAALDGCVEDLAATAAGSRNDALNKKAFRLGRAIARGWIGRDEVEAALIQAMRDNGYEADKGAKAVEATLRSGIDSGLLDPHPDLNGDGDGDTKDSDFEEAATDNSAETPLIKTSEQFVAGFVPPDYLVDGLLQEGFLYSLTGATGAGKTCITLRLAASTALGVVFAGRETKQRRVLYLAAENPDDVRMRWIALSQHMDFEIAKIEVFFVEGVFRISRMAKRLKEEADKHGGNFGLVVIDTSPVFYEGDEENSRTQQGRHAEMLRNLIAIIPGKPTVLANCHPVKNATIDNLVPAGGGNFLNQVDGNLTAAKTDSTIELHTQGKFRGVDFAPMHFLIKTVTHQDVKDSSGRLIPTVICEWISDREKESIAAQKVSDEDAVLQHIADNPKASLASIAIAMDWKLYSGEPNKMKASRCIKALLKHKLIKETRSGTYRLTPEGNAALGKKDEDDDD